MKILGVKNLKVSLSKTEEKIIDDISFEVFDNEIIGIVGESGSGKSTLSLAILGLLDSDDFRVSGNIFYKDKDILILSQRDREKFLGKEMTLIPQNPMTAFNPTLSIGKQMVETIRTMRNISFQGANRISIESLKKVNIKDGESVFDAFPFQLSGGQLQRIMMAICMVMKSEIIFMDEMTASIDIENRNNMILLVKELRRMGSTIIFITHDIKTLYKVADRIIVMKDGKIVESNLTDKILTKSREIYTKRLLEASFIRR